MAAAIGAAGLMLSAVGTGIQIKAAGSGSDYYALAQQQAQQQKKLAQQQRHAEELSYRQQAQTYEANAASLQSQLTMLEKENELDELMTARQVNQIEYRGQAMATEVAKAASLVGGRQVTAAAAGNVSLEGTPALLLADTAKQAADDIADIEQYTALQVEGAQYSAFARGMGRLNQAAGISGQAANLYGASGGAYTAAGFSQQLSGLESSMYGTRAAMYGAQASASLLSDYAGIFSSAGQLAWKASGVDWKKLFSKTH